MNDEVEKRLNDYYDSYINLREASRAVRINPCNETKRAEDRAYDVLGAHGSALVEQITLTRQMATMNDVTLADSAEVAAGRAYYIDQAQALMVPSFVKPWEEVSPWFRMRMIRWATEEITTCQSDNDGDCAWPGCPQLVERQTGCPLYDWNDPDR